MEDLITQLKTLTSEPTQIAALEKETLKTYAGSVNHLGWENDSFGPDVRYYLDAENKLIGLHVSHLTETQHKLFSKNILPLLLSTAHTLEILYLTSFSGDLNISNFPQLAFLNVSQSLELTSLHIDNAPKLTEIHASLCTNLRKVTLGKELDEMEKLDISKSPVETFKTSSKLKNLAYFIAFETKFKPLNLAHISEVKYLIAQNSAISEIDWKKVKSLPNIESIELPSEYTSDINRITEILKQHVGVEMRKELNTYLEILNKSGSKSKSRLKILLLGNTTSGKSTLRRILFSKAGEEKQAANQYGIKENKKEKSTHGAIIETEEFELDSDKCQVQVFDFGGQDYYHATHLPFYQARTWHLLIYGPDEDAQLDSAYTYGQKKVEGREEVLFPITYWLKSLTKNNPPFIFIDSPEERYRTKVNLVQNIKNSSARYFSCKLTLLAVTRLIQTIKVSL